MMWRTATALMFLMVDVGAAATPAGSPLAGEFNTERALVNVYGALEWQDPRIGSVANFAGDRVHVEALFDAAYEENGAAKHVVIATLTPKPKREFSCHACSPILGGAVFRREGDAWVRESTGEVIQTSSAWNTSLQLLKIGRDRHALLHQVNDVSGGEESRRATVIFAVGGELAVRFRADAVDGPGPGACALPGQHLIVRAAEDVAPAQEYFDLVVDAKWNAATCRTTGQGDDLFVSSSGQECRRVSRYRFRQGAYQLLSVDQNTCRPLEEKTASLKG